LLLPHQLPFDAKDLPPVFTHFRQQLENAAIRESAPLPAPDRLQPLPEGFAVWQARSVIPDISISPEIAERQQYSSFPLTHPHWQGGETAALQHLDWYAQKGLTHTYETTRNALQGLDFSSKWSPWLACGALSPRLAMQMIRAAEQQHGENKSTYWHWFELLWRDYFRFYTGNTAVFCIESKDWQPNFTARHSMTLKRGSADQRQYGLRSGRCRHA
jgi:deoxyribodipyrimidine photo-lyase